MMLAAHAGQPASVQKLLDAGANPHARDKRKRSALMLAASGGYTKVAKILLAQPNNDVDSVDKENQTALLLASKNGMLETADLLITAKADVNARSRTGTTALWEAAANGQYLC